MQVAHDRTTTIVVDIVNTGPQSDDRTIELRENGTVVDETEVTVDSESSKTVELNRDHSEDDIGSVYRYRVATGNREPQMDASIVGVWRSDSGGSVAPETQIGRIEMTQSESVTLEENTLYEFIY